MITVREGFRLRSSTFGAAVKAVACAMLLVPGIILTASVNAQTPPTSSKASKHSKASVPSLPPPAPVANNLTANSPDAVTGNPPSSQPGQIRKININLTAKAVRTEKGGDFQRVNLTTSIGPRNLSFRDRYN